MTYSEKLKNPKWQKKRLEILERDKWTCKYCGNKKKTLHIHHLFYYEDYEPWDIPNKYLVTLCYDCHKEIQENQRLLYYEFLQGFVGFDLLPNDLWDFMTFLQYNELKEKFLISYKKFRKKYPKKTYPYYIHINEIKKL